MASRLIKLIRRFAVAWTQHPASRDLVAFRDGQLDEGRCRRISRHLARCARCSEELVQLARAMNTFRDAYRASIDDDLLDLRAARERLRSSIRAHQSASFAHTSLGQALTAELGVYLGSQAAADVLDRVGQEHPDGKTVVTAIEPTLTTFLGRSAGSAVAARLLRMLEVDAEPGADAPLPDVG